MDQYRPGWPRSDRPSPPKDLNGWAIYTTRTLEHLEDMFHARTRETDYRLARIETLQGERLIQNDKWRTNVENRLSDLEERGYAPALPPAGTPDLSQASVRDVVKEFGVMAKEVAALLRNLAALALILSIAFKKIDLELLRAALKFLPGG